MELDRTEDERLTLPGSTTRKSQCVNDDYTYSYPPGLVGFDGVVLEVTEAAQVVTVVLF